MEYLINTANVLYLVSYLVRDILWLRIITVVAALTLIPYLYFRLDPLMTAIYWNLLFVLLNISWITRLLLERRPVQLTGNDLKLYQLVFRCLTPREMRQLLALGRWKSAEPEECLVKQGDELDRLMVICAGRARIVRAGLPVDELQQGQFIGGISFITEDSAPADVFAVEETHYMCWPKAALRSFLKEKADLRSALQLTLGFDLTQRLQAAYDRGPGV